MRISTNQIYARGTNNLLDQQTKLNQLQNQLSGTRVNTPSDDPIASAQIELMKQRLNSTQIYQNNNQNLSSALNLQDGVESSVISSIQSLLTLQSQSQSGVLSQADRQSLGTQVQKILDQLVSYGNSTGLNGEYIFGGSQTDKPPISRSFNPLTNSYDYSYNGDSKQRFQPISSSLQVAANDPGDEVFMNIPAGNGNYSIKQTANPNNGTVVALGEAAVDASSITPGNYSITINTPANTVKIVDGSNNEVLGSPFPYESGKAISFNGISITLTGQPADGQSFSLQTGQNQSLFATAQRMLDNLNAPFTTPADKAATQTENSQINMQLKNALSHLTLKRADLGSRANQLSNTSDVNANMNLINQEVVTQLQSSDIISVTSQYQLQLVSLKAAQQSFVQIQGLSVFNYIS
ncbi:flagellar hook-associated protein FlgL [Legionella sp. km772]|uniref:flagellar hook-associated protein FlgL n=1 Tax=Legionella sp. km772 TaxID=2498111 RepID=UPI000F8E0A52|nr:flagellar hook-associated protein FlgL [Legionella sp. km772]RUR04878.1 flagellar hook-associated protein 3 [Legionella sp. km772]